MEQIYDNLWQKHTFGDLPIFSNVMLYSFAMYIRNN